MILRARHCGLVFLGASSVALGWAGCSSSADSSPSGPGASGAGGGSSSSSSSASSSSGNGGASSSSSSTSSSSGAGGGLATKRPYPDTSATIGILADQLPGGLSAAQQQFAVAHFVGTQKLTLDQSKPLRALNPDFLVLHYHLAIWQSAPAVQFIVDGSTWGNDYSTVTTHESWFWHNTQASRIQSNVDDKYLMNLGDPDFRAYFRDSFLAQVMAGDYDGVFADSASPALLNFEAQKPAEPRLQGTGVKDTPIPELGGKTYIEAWQDFMTEMDAALAAKGIPLLPNTGAFITGWDTTKYDLTAGIFSEGFADPAFAENDWKASTNELLKLAGEGKIMILQNYLGSPGDLAKRRYYLANYLLVKGQRTYLDYFAGGPMEWYPEWGVDLGAAAKTGATVDDLAASGVYRRDFQKGLVLVNPSGADVTVDLGGSFQRIEPQGGGAIDAAGTTPGTLGTTAVTTILVPAHGAEIVVK